jgi:hypothetical protein
MIPDLIGIPINDLSGLKYKDNFILTNHKVGSSGLRHTLGAVKLKGELPKNINNKNFILVVRNPLERFASLYRFSLVKIQFRNKTI